ncbi:MAG: hypothetical protein U0869_24325 [Chloroflexota bacterium]
MALALLLVVAVPLVLAGALTAQDLAAHGAIVVQRSAIPDAIDTGEVRALKLAAGGSDVHAADLEVAAAFVRGANDGSDFRLITLLRLLLAYPDRLDGAATGLLRDVLLGVRWWMDEPGMNPMVYWSENHQALFAAGEHLAGARYPDERFADGRTGAEHRDDAAARLRFWLDQRWAHGFSEWDSHYAAEDIAALSALVDLAPDPELAKRAEIILDLLLLDLASHAFRGELAATSGRLYEANRMDGDPIVRRILAHAFEGADLVAASDAIDIGFQLSGFRAPPVLAAIAHDLGPRSVAQGFGRDPADIVADPAIASDEERIMELWGTEAFTDPAAIEATFDWIRAHGLLANPYLAPFRQLDFRVLRLTGALPILSRLLALPANGTTLGRADTLTERTPDFQMSTTQAYRPGEPGNQQAVFQLVLGPGLTVFHTHPGAAAGEAGPNGGTPGYWTGSGILPVSCQVGGVNLSLYDLPDHPGFGLARLLELTHLHAPIAEADGVVEDDHHRFLQVGSALVGVTASSPLRVGDADEIIQDGRRTAWAVEAASSGDETFAAFVERVRGAELTVDGSTATYRSGGTTITASMDSGCAVDGVALAPVTGRLPSPYARAEDDGRRVRVEWGGHGLLLDWDAATIRSW